MMGQRSWRSASSRRGVWLIGLAALGSVVLVGSPAGAATGRASVKAFNPTQAVDASQVVGTFETTIVAKKVALNLGNGVTATNAYTYGGTVPGPEIRVKVGTRVVVHFKNELTEPSSIHWHGVEVPNVSDGTGITQNQVLPGGTFDYRFIVSRPGVFWYHPHMAPTNAEFKGQYGSLIVYDDADLELQRLGVLPSRRFTRTLVLGDTTVCPNVVGDPFTFPANPALPWVGTEDGLGPYPGLLARPLESDMCDNPLDNEGNPTGGGMLPGGTIPNIQPPVACNGQGGVVPFCRVNEGQLVKTNGVVVAPRAGSPTSPGNLGAGQGVTDVHVGEGWRLQVINTSVTRYNRLRLTDDNGNTLTLFRVGGEGGVLNRVRVEGGIQGTLDTRYNVGEILLGPGNRADVVFRIPNAAVGDILTLWTQDYERQGAGPGDGYSPIPTAPVAHFRIVAGSTRGPDETFQIAINAPLRLHPLVNAPVENIKSLPLDSLINPGTLSSPLLGNATPILGTTNANIIMTVSGPSGLLGINGVNAEILHHGTNDFLSVPFVGSSRYAAVGDVLELTYRNNTNAHHPMHLHGFSIQPVRVVSNATNLTVRTFDYDEFVDTIDVPAGHRIVFRVRLDDRLKPDFASPGGAVGRWVLHCHIFFHAGLGMNSELVVLDPATLGPVASRADGTEPAEEEPRDVGPVPDHLHH